MNAHAQVRMSHTCISADADACECIMLLVSLGKGIFGAAAWGACACCVVLVCGSGVWPRVTEHQMAVQKL